MPGMKLRFSIRDLLWLAIVVALLAALWLQKNDSQRLAKGLRKEEFANHNRDLELQLLQEQLAFTRDQLSSMTEQLIAPKNSTQK
jgi:hypothetical protein